MAHCPLTVLLWKNDEPVRSETSWLKLLLFVPRWWRLIGPAHCFKTSTAPNFGVQRRDWENELAHGGAAVEKGALGLRSDTAVQTRTPSGRHTGANHRVRRWEWGNRGASPCLQHRYANRSRTLTNISRLAANVFSMPWSKKLHLRHKTVPRTVSFRF